MTRGDEHRVADILEACDSLATVVQLRASKSVDPGVLLRAAERLLEIIGEAATNCSDALKARYPGIDWSGLAGLRVVLAHHYHRTAPGLVWRFAEVDAPRLRAALSSNSDSPA